MRASEVPADIKAMEPPVTRYREYRSTNSITEIISPSLVLNKVIEPQDLKKDLIDEYAATIALSVRNGNHPWTEIHY